MSAINMSYSVVVMSYDRLYAIRDPYGNRPLCVGTAYDNERELVRRCKIDMCRSYQKIRSGRTASQGRFQKTHRSAVDDRRNTMHQEHATFHFFQSRHPCPLLTTQHQRHARYRVQQS